MAIALRLEQLRGSAVPVPDLDIRYSDKPTTPIRFDHCMVVYPNRDFTVINGGSINLRVDVLLPGSGGSVVSQDGQIQVLDFQNTMKVFLGQRASLIITGI